MKINTSNLIGPQLDWAVAKCAKKLPISHQASSRHWWSPSTNWNHGGPIIEREVSGYTKRGPIDKSYFEAWVSPQRSELEPIPYGDGDTLLVAAMRCYVASKLGNTVDIPEELS